MKISLLSTAALLGVASAQQACIEGQKVTISPGYTVEYRCDVFRAGTVHNNIQSADECAALCRDASRSVCTYNKQKCIVGDENGKEGKSPGAFYMVKVDEEAEDPFADDPEDPFAQSCEEEKDDCLRREAALSQKLTKCQADLAAAQSATPPPPGQRCGVAMWGQGWYDRKTNVNLADCKKLCQEDSKCLSYSDNKLGTPGSGPNNCYLYDKLTKDVPTGTYPNWVQYDKSCP